MPPCRKPRPVQLSAEDIPAHKELEHGLTAVCAASTPTPQLHQLLGEADATAIFHNDRLKPLEQRDRGCLRLQAHLREPLQQSLQKGDGFGRKALMPATGGDLHVAPPGHLRHAV
jgi:hypothetical protein